MPVGAFVRGVVVGEWDSFLRTFRKESLGKENKDCQRWLTNNKYNSIPFDILSIKLSYISKHIKHHEQD